MHLLPRSHSQYRIPRPDISQRLNSGLLPSPHFSPRVWKGGASAPPLQDPPDYSRVPCPAQSRRRGTARGTGPTEGGAAISAGLKPRPSRSPLRVSKRGEKSGLDWYSAFSPYCSHPLRLPWRPMPMASFIPKPAGARALPKLKISCCYE
jgi:hypothetical protein